MVSKKSLPISLWAYKKRGKSSIELRTLILDPEIIEGVITAAFEDKAILVYPIMRHKPLAIGRLIEVGILEKDKTDGKYVFAMKKEK